jgi:hypothetical protein
MTKPWEHLRLRDMVSPLTTLSLKGNSRLDSDSVKRQAKNMKQGKKAHNKRKKLKVFVFFEESGGGPTENFIEEEKRKCYNLASLQKLNREI